MLNRWLRSSGNSPSISSFEVHNSSVSEQGFALPLAMGLGFVMVILGMSTMMIAQSDRTSAFNRKEAGASLAIAEGGIVLNAPTGDPDTTYATGVLALRGREIQGSQGNVYFHPSSSADPSLTASAAPGDASRSNYLNAIWSSSSGDGANGDTVQGSLFACTLRPRIPDGIKGTNFGAIDSDTTFKGLGGATPTLYQVEEIDLEGNETLTVDTTNGPVQIDVENGASSGPGIVLRDNAKILNIRTDGQPARVGDLRILGRKDYRVTLYDQACIHNAFLYFPYDELRLLTTGAGCPGGQNTNVEGVLWMEAILSSKNEATHRDVKYLGYGGEDYDTTTKSGVTSGIAVPEDVTSLIDLLKYIDWPARYRFGGVLQWQRVRL